MPAQHATCLAALQLSAVPSSAPHPALCSCPTNDHPLSYKESCATVDPLASRTPLMPSLASEHCDCIMRITRGVAQRALIWRTHSRRSSSTLSDHPARHGGTYCCVGHNWLVLQVLRGGRGRIGWRASRASPAANPARQRASPH